MNVENTGPGVEWTDLHIVEDEEQSIYVQPSIEVQWVPDWWR